VAAAENGKRIVFLGPPNSGKGTQAGRLAAALGIPAISTGEMLRAAVVAGSTLGQQVARIMAKGWLVSDELMADVVRERLGKADVDHGFLLDGYPRTGSQVQTLEEIVAAAGRPVDHVVLIDAPEEVLIARALGRGREDDREAVIRERLVEYDEKTAPLIEHYERLGVLRRVDGNQTIEQVQQSVLEAVGAA